MDRTFQGTLQTLESKIVFVLNHKNDFTHVIVMWVRLLGLPSLPSITIKRPTRDVAHTVIGTEGHAVMVFGREAWSDTARCSLVCTRHSGRRRVARELVRRPGDGRHCEEW